MRLQVWRLQLQSRSLQLQVSQLRPLQIQVLQLNMVKTCRVSLIHRRQVQVVLATTPTVATSAFSFRQLLIFLPPVANI